MAARGILGLLSLILVAGGLLLGLFILLAGAIEHSPINEWYFLQVDSANIPNAPQVARWTFWRICEGESGRSVCSGTAPYNNLKPAFRFNPPSSSNFGTNTNIPAQFIGTNFYDYASVSMFAFALVALLFGALALFTGVLACCTRLGAYISGLLTTLAFLFQAVAAALMTSIFVKGRDAFRSNGQAANISTYAFGFEWATFACFFLATILFCAGGRGKKDSFKSSSGPAKGSFFKGGRSTSTRSRGSFINGEKEYE